VAASKLFCIAFEVLAWWVTIPVALSRETWFIWKVAEGAEIVPKSDGCPPPIKGETRAEKSKFYRNLWIFIIKFCS